MEAVKFSIIGWALINKFVFAALAHQTMSTAYAVILNERCGSEYLKILKSDFKPLMPAEFLMARVLIGEYLYSKTAYQGIQPDNFMTMVHMDRPFEDPEHWLKSYLQRPFFYLLYKPNMTLAIQRRYFDLLIDAQTRQPPDFSKAQDYLEAHNRTPTQRNMIGWLLLNIGMPDFSQYSRMLQHRKVQSDLLACAINTRLNAPEVIEDYYIKGPCRFVEKGRQITSPGPDGQYGSEDDITLKTPKSNYGKPCDN